MVTNDSKFFMFIEPKSKKMEADIIDNITLFTEALMNKMKSRNDFTKGFHTCQCGKAHSASHTYAVNIAGKSYITNNLILHYVKNHRSEVSEHFLDILRKGIEFEKNKIEANT